MNNKENGIVSSIQFHFHNICEHIVLFVFQRLIIHFIKKTSEQFYSLRSSLQVSVIVLISGPNGGKWISKQTCGLLKAFIRSLRCQLPRRFTNIQNILLLPHFVSVSMISQRCLVKLWCFPCLSQAHSKLESCLSCKTLIKTGEVLHSVGAGGIMVSYCSVNCMNKGKLTTTSVISE